MAPDPHNVEAPSRVRSARGPYALHRANTRPRRWPARLQAVREIAPTALAVALGLLLALGFHRTMHNQVENVARYDFSEESKTCIRLFERGLQSNIDRVRWLGATFTAAPDLNRRQFHDLASALDKDTTGAMELLWLPRVAAQDRPAFEAAPHGHGAPSFAIREADPDGVHVPAGARKEYFPIYFSQAEDTRPDYLGLDLMADPGLRRFLNLAADKGQMFFVSEAPYVQSLAGRGAVLALCPVYKKGSPDGTPQERRANLLGFTAGLIRLDALADTAFSVLSQLEIDVHVFDYFGAPGRQLLYYRPGRSQPRATPYIEEGNLQVLETLNYVGAISLGETRRWLIACTPAPDYAFGIRSWSPWLGLALGLAITAAMGYHFHANIRQRRAAEELVVRRTAELKRTNDRLVHEVAARKRFELERDDLLALLEASNTSLQQLNGRLERSNRDLQDFALVASHDLKEPLRKVRVLAGSLREQWGAQLESAAREYLDLMDAALLRMHHLITNLLRVSRIATHGQPFEQVDLTQILADVVSDLAVRIEETEGAIEIGSVPALEADPMQMRQCFQNILDNSLKYHREGVPPRIRIEAAEPVPGEAPGTCTIIVRDNGTGIAPELTERAFTLFQRLDNGARVEGSGVGLAVCRKIAERHGGTIAVSSEAGKGSTFSITLPLVHNGPRESGWGDV